VHLPAIQNHPKAELLAVQKRSREAAIAVAEKYGVPHACSSMEEVLAIRGLDAVIISSTPNIHYTQVKAALERGLHVLVEKPMTFTRAEAEELVALAERKKIHFLISCPWHYTPHSLETRRRLLAGALGRIRMISMLMTNFTGGLYRGETLSDMMARRGVIKDYTEQPPDPQPGSYSDPKIAGGGQIYCQISHVAAWLSFVTGLEPAEVFARFNNNGLAVDVHDVLNLKMEDGTLVSIASSGAPMPSERTFEVRIFGEKGMAFLDLWKGTAAFYDEKGTVTGLPPMDEIYPSAAPAVNLIDTVLGRTENGSPARLGLSAMKVIEAACRSAESGENIRI
jgi:predicted dehydrogenase